MSVADRVAGEGDDGSDEADPDDGSEDDDGSGDDGTGDDGEDEDGSVTVEEIDGTFSGGRNQDRHLGITVTIGADAAAVSEVEVSVTVTGDDGSERMFAGTTGSDGTVDFTWNNASSGADCFTATVTGISADGWDGQEDSEEVCRSG